MIAMSTMNISLPDGMRSFIDAQVAERGFGTSSEFIRDLIRKEQERLQVRNLMLEGAASHRTGEPDAQYFSSLRARAKGVVGRKSSRKT